MNALSSNKRIFSMALQTDNTKGFTLIEVMIAMAIAGFVTMAIYVSFATQQRSQVREKQVVEMQQNARAAILLMERAIRTAGNDPTTVWGNDGEDNAIDGNHPSSPAFAGGPDDAIEAENNRLVDTVDNDCSGAHDDTNADGVDESYGVKRAGAHEIIVSMDLNGDRDVCDADEYIRYRLDPAEDADGDGRVDSGVGSLEMTRSYTASWQPIAGNIEAIGFAYAFDTDDPPDGLDEDGGGDVIWAYDSNTADAVHELDTRVFDDGSTAALGTNVDVGDIKAVRIWLLARSRFPVRGYNDVRQYVVGDLVVDTAATADSMRRLLTTTVVCRNMGLE
jgi:type IV pilus assembly protein PilW